MASSASSEWVRVEPDAFDEEELLGWSDEADDEDDGNELPRKPPTKIEAENALEELLVGMHLRGEMTAKLVCTICFWCKYAGVGGLVAKLALRPNAPSGHFSRKLKATLMLDKIDKRLMRIDVPGHDRHNPGRVVHEVACVPPHEVLNAEYARHPEVGNSFAEAKAQGELPPSYFEHPIAQATAHQALPVSLYLDGVPFAKNDAVLGIWAYFAHSSKRHLLLALRKSRICRCGCKGWCSLSAVFRWLGWSIVALAVGVFPAQRHDQRDWDGEHDVERASVAGLPMAMVGAITAIKGDWLEYCTSLGSPTWQSRLHPCLYCHAKQSTLDADSSLSPINFPWPTKGHDDYEAACHRCELPRSLDRQQHAEVLAALRYDKRPQGSRGRALSCNVPSCELLMGDRLEPSDELPNVGDFDSIRIFPARVIFWRPSNETSVRHRNPLFNPTVGVVVDLLVVDPLHAVNLGVLKQLCIDVVWEMILSDVYRIRGKRGSQREFLEYIVGMLRNDLFSWYRKKGRVHTNMTRLQDLTLKMLGTPTKRHFQAKAAESKWFLMFLDDFLVKHSGKLERGDLWQRATSLMVDFVQSLQNAPRVLRAGQIQDLRRGARVWERLKLK